MMTQKLFRLSAIGAALAAAFSPVLADEVSELIEPDSTISVGVGNWSSDRRQTGMYDGMRDGKVYPLIDADIVKRDNETGTWYKFETRNLGLDTRDIKGEVLRQGNWGIGLEYNRIQRDDPNIYNTNVLGIGMSNLATGTTRYNADLGTRRQQLNLNFYKNLMPGLDLNLNYKNEDKTGARIWSAGSDNFFPEPIDSTIRQMEAALSWTTEKFQLRGGYYGSWYRNDVSNAATLNGGPALSAGTTLMSLPLDNQAHQLFLNGGYNFTKDTRGTFKLEYARATQDENFSILPTLAGAPGSLDAEVVTKLLQLGLTSRVTKDFSVNANLRYHDKDDKTPNNFNFGGNAPDTHPYFRQSVRTLSGKVEGVYRFANAYSLVGSIEEKRRKYDLPTNADGTNRLTKVAFRDKLDETTGRLELRRSLTETVNGSLSWVHAKRDGSLYGPMQTSNEGLINPISIADRTRDTARLSVDWMPIEPLSLQFVIENSKDKYGGPSAYGLEEGKNQLYSIDASWTVNDKLSFNAWYSMDRTTAKQTGRVGTTVGTLRRYDVEDNGDSLGLGIKWEATSKLRTGANLEWLKSVGNYDVAAWNASGALYDGGVPAGRGSPDITNKHVRLSLFAMYALNKASDLRFDVIYDKWKTNDWTWMYTDGLYSDGLNMGTGTSVISRPNESATFVGVRYIYKFQ